MSDTHSYWDDKYVKHFDCCDEIWHAGDIGSIHIIEKLNNIKPVKAVYGNIDDSKTRLIYPEFQRFISEDVDVLITHIGGYPGKYAPKVLSIMQTNPPKLFICGHSHILKVMYDKKHNCLTINPGAAGKYGFHKVRTLIRFILDKGNISNLEIIELSD